MTLNANIPDLDDPSKLRVGPAFLPPALYGPYWVVFAGGENAPEEYDYGIVSGAPADVNGAGLWLFSKSPVASPEVLSLLEAKTKELGFDLDATLPVTQEGCAYDEANGSR